MFAGAGTAAAFISGAADIVLPLLAAAELVYLSLMSTNQNFQNQVDGIDPADSKKIRNAAPKALQMLETLSPEDRRLYGTLKNRCGKLRQLARQLKGETAGDMSGITDIQIEELNRLLWIFLKLLFSKNALESFFKTINIKEIEAGVQRNQKKLSSLDAAGYNIAKDDPWKDQRREVLIDTLKTAQQRLSNYQTAQKNYDFINLELERLYSKISALVETGINRQDPGALSTEIDVVSSSLADTEQAMMELEFITGSLKEQGDVPALLEDV